MQEFVIRCDDGTIQSVICDAIEEITFFEEKGFKHFLLTHPSCFYSNKRILDNGNIKVIFNQYFHKCNDGINRLSYNSIPMYDNECWDYDSLKMAEEILLRELNKIQNRIKQFEDILVK
jgi:hypothetical protein